MFQEVLTIQIHRSVDVSSSPVHIEDEGNSSAIYHSTWRNFPEDVYHNIALIFILWRYSPTRVWGASLFRFLHHTQLGHTHRAGLLWTSDQPVAQAATYTTHNKQNRRTSMPQPDSNPRSQPPSSCRPKPETARSPKSAKPKMPMFPSWR